MTTATLADVCSLITDGTHYTPPDLDEGLPFLTVKDISEAGLDFANCSRISEEEFLRACAGNSSPQPGDVLFSKDGTVGKVHVVDGETPFAVLSSIAILRPGESIDSRYLGHMLRTENLQGQAVRRKSGSAIRRIILSDLRKVEIPLPPLAKQRRIAAILDQAESLRAMRRQTLTRLEDLAESVFLDRFGGFSGKFLTVDEVAASEKGSIRTGPFGSQLLHGEFVDRGIAVLGLDNVVGNQFSWKERRYITPEKYQQLRRYTVHPGDVLVSIMGTCGRCVVVPSDVGTAINTKHICAITLDQNIVLPEFVRAAFLLHPRSREHLAQRTKGSIMDGLNMGIVKEMPLPVPELEDQHEFVERVRQVETLSNSCLGSSVDLDDLFVSVQSRAFSGLL